MGIRVGGHRNRPPPGQGTGDTVSDIAEEGLLAEDDGDVEVLRALT
jgi:hypothetical protein